MTYCEKSCARMLDFRPPRIAITLLVIATVLQLLPLVGSVQVLTHPAAGVSMIAAGFGIMIRAWWLFRQHRTAICPTAETTSFITDDIYALTRNPMYLGMVLMLLGIALLAGRWPYYLAAVIYVLILDHVFCRYEEAKLLQQYGRRYADYTARVRRWL
jgi:protein-S-isoprenylcysteine O-methyltransferase Ste14